jgi:Mnd1 HTH domain
MLPSVASINSIQVKESITALVNDNKIRVEKIGSNNWYWSFPSDERRERESMQERLLREMNRVAKLVEQLEDEIQKKEAAAKEDEGFHHDPAVIQAEREDLMKRKADLGTEIERLRKEKSAFEANDFASLRQKTEDIAKWKLEATTWTDNIDIMEQYLTKLASGDRELVQNVKKQCYGEDYMDGDDL